MENTLSLVWLGLTYTLCNGASLLQGDTQDKVYLYSSHPESSTIPALSSPPLGGLVRSLFNSPADGSSSREDDSNPSYSSRGNIHRSFAYVTTTPRTTPHFEALTGERNESRIGRPRTFFIDNERVEVQNAQQLVDKFRELRRGHKGVSYGRSTTPANDVKSYEEEVDGNGSSGRLNEHSGPHVNVQQVPIRHWSTDSNIIREDDPNGSLSGFAYVTPRHSSEHQSNFRGNVKYSSPTSERPNRPTYEPDYDSRSGKTLPPQQFESTYDNRRAYIAPTTYRPPFSTNDPGTYSFSIRGKNHSRQESGDSRGYFRGSIKFMDTFGRDKQIHYEGSPERGIITSEAPYVSIDGRSGQRYIPPVTSPRSSTPNVPSYSYSYTTNDPALGSSTVAYKDFRSPTPSGYPVTEGYSRTTPSRYPVTEGYSYTTPSGYPVTEGYSRTTPSRYPVTEGYSYTTPSGYPVTEGYSYTTPSSLNTIPTPDGSYRFSYDAGDHQRQEARDNRGNVQGMYSFDDVDGSRKMVRYEATARNGFVAQGQHLPVQGARILTGGPQYIPNSGDQPSDGSYFFSYDAGNHARQEIRDGNGNVQGYYTFLTGDGEMKTVHYVANPEDGFIARGDHLPAHGGGYDMSYRVRRENEESKTKPLTT